MFSTLDERNFNGKRAFEGKISRKLLKTTCVRDGRPYNRRPNPYTIPLSRLLYTVSVRFFGWQLTARTRLNFYEISSYSSILEADVGSRLHVAVNLRE